METRINTNNVIVLNAALQEVKKMFSAVGLLPPYLELSDDDEEEKLVKRKLIRLKEYVESVIPGYSDRQFQMHFRIQRQVYNSLVPIVNNIIGKESYIGRQQIDIDKQILAVLWLLATPDSYRSVSERFDMGKSSLYVSFVRVVKVLNYLAQHIICWPNEAKIAEIQHKFRQIAGIDDVIGSIDGTFVSIKAPKDHPEVYITRKCTYAITLQAVCDSSLRFTDCFVGYPGSVSDTRVFRNSNIYKDVDENVRKFFPNEQFIIGDKAYPILPWCIPPYTDRGNLTVAQRNFNYKISQTRQVIERAFALLFGRFRRLKFLDMNNFKLIPYTIMAACVLHNLCLQDFDVFLESYIEEGRSNLEGNNELENITDNNKFLNDANSKRDIICRNLLNHHM